MNFILAHWTNKYDDEGIRNLMLVVASIVILGSLLNYVLMKIFGKFPKNHNNKTRDKR